MADKVCHHDSIDTTTSICNTCGIYVTDGHVFVETADYEDTRNVSHRKKPLKVLYPNRVNIKLQDDIIDRAEEISRQMKIKHNRDKRLVRRQFACLYFACLEAKKANPKRILNLNPERLADYVGLDRVQVPRAISDFSPFRSGYRPAVVSDTEFKRLPCVEIALDNAHALGIPKERYPDIENLIETTIQKSESQLTGRTAQTIAAGAIMAYNSMYSVNLSLDEILKSVSLSTTQTVCDIIINANNS